MADNKSSKFGLGVILGTVVGAVAGILFAPQKGEKTRELLKKEKERLEILIKEKNVDKKVKEIFDTVNSETRKLYREAEIKLIEKLSKAKEGWENLDKEKYKKLVGEVVDGFKKEPKVGIKRAEKLKKQLLLDWNKLQKSKTKKASSSSKK